MNNNTNEKLQIHLNSRHATKYNNEHYSDCDFVLPIIEAESQYTIYIGVMHVVIPYSFYNINSRNNLLCYNEYTANPQITTNLYIPYGNYNANQLAAFFTNNLPRTTCSYSSITNKFTFVNTTYDFKILTANSTCQNLIGLSTNDLSNTSNNKTLTLAKQVNLSAIRMINMATNFNSGCINNFQNNAHDVLACIPIQSSPYSMINFSNSHNFSVNLNTNVMNFINIKLLDQDGNTLELNQQYFSITLQLEIVDFVE
jgi:hypothetical protein